MIKSIPFWVFWFLVVWIGGSLLALFTCCPGVGLIGGLVGGGGATTAITAPVGAAATAAAFKATPLLVADGATRVGAYAKDNLRFGVGKSQPMMSNGVKAEYQKVGQYLKDHPNKDLTLVGEYTKKEGKPVGIARGESLKKHLLGLGLGIPAAQILVNAKQVGSLPTKDNEVYGAMGYNFTEKAPTIVKEINIRDGAKFNKGTNDNLVFPESGYEYKKPISKKLEGVFQNTATYLKNNPGRSIKLTGFYGDKERNTGIFANLGLARAGNVKNILTGMGVPANQIETNSIKQSGLTFTKKELVGGVNYTFFNTPKGTDSRLADIEGRLKGKPIMLYFETGKNTLNLTSQQRKDFADLMYYLDRKPKAAITSTGHTDSKGNRNGNVRLGQKRADFVKNYLQKNGASTKQISTASKGPDKPISTNDTEDGRAKNRRVEVILK